MPYRKSLNEIVSQVVPTTLTDAATIATDANLGRHFRVSIGADRTLGVPTNPTDAQRVVWEITASGAQRVITLTTGSSGSFELTAGISAATAIASGKTAFIAAIYNSSRARWSVLSYRVLS
jgi:predicted secreted protein